MQFVLPENVSLFTLVLIVIGVIITIQGVASLITGKMYGKEYQKYTEASVAKAARPMGLMMLLAGVALMASQFVVFDGLDADTSRWILSGVTLVFVAISIIMSLVMLKKKNGAKK